MSMRDIFQAIVAFGLVVAMVLGAITFFATTKDLANAEEKAKERDQAILYELKLTQKMLEQKIGFDQILDLKRRMRQLEEWNKWKPIHQWSAKDRAEYTQLEIELKEAEENLREIKKRKIPEATFK